MQRELVGRGELRGAGSTTESARLTNSSDIPGGFGSIGILISPWSRGRANLPEFIAVTAKERAMASRLNPYISFQDNARQALEFYKDVFGGDLRMNTFGEFGQQDSPDADKIMHGQLDTPKGFTLMASDTPAGMQRNPGDNITVSLSGDDADELRGYWEKLSDGGTVTMPLEKQMWGDEFGMCVDRFGVPWMVNIGQQQA
jgi:PhnB protein